MPVRPENRPNGLGPKLRALRQSAQMSIRELATQAGLSPGYVSQVERDLINPSLGALKGLADVVGVPVVELFVDENQHPPAHTVVRRGEGLRFTYPGSDATNELLSADARGPIQFALMTVPPGGTTGRLRLRHAGTECAYVLSGRIHLIIGREVHDLEAEDSLCYRSSIPHRWHNETSEEVRLLLAGTPPSIF